MTIINEKQSDDGIRQTDLEIQNEKLRRTIEKMEKLQNRCIELYDFAPVGYVTIDEHGVILESNRNFATLIGVSKDSLINTPLAHFILKKDQVGYQLFQSKLLESEEESVCEIRLFLSVSFWVCLKGKRLLDKKIGKFVGLIIVIDIDKYKQTEEKLKKSNDNLSQMVENSPILIYSKDLAGKYTIINKKFEELSGLKREEVINRTDFEIFPEIAAQSVENDRQVIKTAFPLEAEELAPVQGQMRTFLTAKYPLMNSEGELCGICGFSMDIEKRKQTEEALKHSEEKYRALVEQSMDMLFLYDLEGNFLDVNKAAVEKTGYSEKELLCLKVFDLLSEKSDHNQILYQWKSWSVGQHLTLETEFISKEATVIPVEVNTGKISMGKRDYILALVRDITMRKRTEEALIESEERFRLFLERLPGGVIAHDLNGRILFCNEIACKNTGYSKEELLGMSVGDIDPGSINRNDRICLWNSLNMGQSTTIESTHIRKDGSQYSAEIHLNVVKLQGKPIILPVVFDITERKRAEAAIEDAHHRLLTVLNSMDAGIYVADMETYELLFINRYTQGIHGNIIGKKCWQTLQKGKTGPCEFCTNDKLLDADGKPTGVYLWEIYNPKTERWYECRDNALRWIDGRMVRLEIALDITERKNAEEAIRESEQKYRTLFEESLNPILVVDENGQYIDANRAALEFLECEREELLCRNVWDFMPSAKFDMKQDHTSLFSHQTNEIEFVVHNATKTLMLNVVPLEIKGRNLLYGIGQDITERKQNEKIIKDSLREKETLLKEIHHRVKNNMQVISSLLNLQIMRDKDGKIKKALMDCKGRINSMASAHEMLYTSDSLSLIDCQAYILKLAQNILQSYQADLHRVKLTVDAKGITLGIQQASSLGLIINELLSNALKYGFPDNMHGRIMVSLKMSEPDIMKFVFMDNGVGIPEDLDWEHTKSLGLNLIVLLTKNQLGGTISMDSGEGTCFTIKFNRETNSPESIMK